MKSEAYPPLTSLLPSLPRYIYLFLSLSGLVSVFLRENERHLLPLSVEKREDIILLRTRHKVKYRRHKRRTRPWTSLVLRIGTNEEEKKKKRKTREKKRRRKDRGTRKGAPTGYSYRRGADERDRRAGNLPVALCSFYTRPSAKSLKRLPI